MQSQNNFYDVTGKLVHAQVGFPAGTTVSCYGVESTCSTVPTDITLSYAADSVFSPGVSSQNPCCFVDDIFFFKYYTALGSRCQSCSGKQLFYEMFIMVSDIHCLTETSIIVQDST